MKYVLTGGPGVGKTTLLQILKEHGYIVLEEKARAIIEAEQAKNSKVLPWKDLFLFQQKLAEEQLNEENKYQDRDIFCDRGIIDGCVYCQIGQVAIPSEITNNGRDRYDLVFILDPLPNYQKDETRKEDPEMAKNIHLAIKQAYEGFGYEPIKIPVETAENRAQMIIEIVNNLPKK